MKASRARFFLDQSSSLCRKHIVAGNVNVAAYYARAAVRMAIRLCPEIRESA